MRLTTFEKWDLSDIFGYETELDSNGKTKWVTKVWCKLCCSHTDACTGQQLSLRGSAHDLANNFMVGTNNVTKDNLCKHLKTTTHQAAVGASTSVAKISPQDGPLKTASGQMVLPRNINQPSIATAMQSAAREGTFKLINTAYMLAARGRPLSLFNDMVRVQKTNGVKLLKNKDNTDTARELVRCIARAMKNYMSQMIKASIFYTSLFDGAQSKKTGSEKEMFFARVVHQGKPVCLAIGLGDVDRYGNADADNLHKCLRDLFTDASGLALERDDFYNGMVSAVADGASVNFGSINGVLAQISVKCPWLLKVHCVNHRIELSLKDSLTQVKWFQRVSDLLVSIYYTLSRSGKLKRIIKDGGVALDVQVYSFTNPKGTRFVSHHRRAVESLLNNWIPAANSLESALAENQVSNKLEGKVKNWLNFFHSYKVLCHAELFLKYLEVMSKFSLSMEKDGLFVHEVMPNLQKTFLQLDNITDGDISSKFQLEVNNRYTMSF